MSPSSQRTQSNAEKSNPLVFQHDFPLLRLDAAVPPCVLVIMMLGNVILGYIIIVQRRSIRKTVGKGKGSAHLIRSL